MATQHGYAYENRCKPSCAPDDISRRGSNAYVEMSTCKRCGHQTKTKKTAAKDSSSCTHERTTSTGSSSKTCRLWCLDCQTYVAEEKREERKKTNPGMKPSKDTIAFENRPNPEMTSSQMLLIASTFKAMVRTHSRQMATTDTITHRELEQFLGFRRHQSAIEHQSQYSVANSVCWSSGEFMAHGGIIEFIPQP